ncbi:MAG: VWA domain-containing protein [Nannocystaceae bacterium]|nr:VWA domain-containing protein [Nannocystaceae bacterium]
MMHRHLTLAGMLCVAGGCPSSDAGGDTSDESGGIASFSGTDTDGSTTDVNPTTGVDTVADTGSSSGGELNCGEQEFVLEAVPPNVVLVLDKSGSMVQQEWDADNDPVTAEETRWRSLHDVVSFVVGTFESEINFGAVLFPSTSAIAELGAGACVVNAEPEVPVAATNAAGVLDGIPGAGAVGTIIGATPATAGVQTAINHLNTLDENIDRFMILITDGAANCGAGADTGMCPGLGCGLMEDYDTNLSSVVGDAFSNDGVPTFVIGIDILDQLLGEEPDDGQVGANTFTELNTVAEAGGRARDGDEKFFNATNEIELQDALAEIAGQVVSCTIPLSEAPTDPDFVEIEIGGMTFERVEDCETDDGWVYSNPEGPYDAIELCNAACDALAESGELDATFGCPPPG